LLAIRRQAALRLLERGVRAFVPVVPPKIAALLHPRELEVAGISARGIVGILVIS
jgi:hypothetical protein